MAYIITPSEKARAKTNPQPTSSTGNGDISKLRLFLKNLFGLPIPILQMTFIFCFLLSVLFLDYSLWLLLICGAAYLLIDILGRPRESKLYFGGFEAVTIVWLIVSAISYWLGENESWLNYWLFNRWFLSILIIPHILNLFPGINKFYYAWFSVGSLMVVFAIYQHVSGFYIYNLFPPELIKTMFYYDAYVAQGFFQKPILLGISLSFIVGFLWSAFFIDLKYRSKPNYLILLTCFLFCIGSYLTFDMRIWLCVCISLFLPALLTKKKYFLVSAMTSVFICFALFLSFDTFRDLYLITESKFEVLRSKMDNINEINFEIISSSPLLGDGQLHHFINQSVGLNPNKYGAFPEAKNNFITILTHTGIIGLIVYMIFCIQAMLLNFRLLKEIPRTHYWHKVFALGSLVLQANFHFLGLYFPTFFHILSLHFFILTICIVIYMSDAYGRGIVPDDSSL